MRIIRKGTISAVKCCYDKTSNLTKLFPRRIQAIRKKNYKSDLVT